MAIHAIDFDCVSRFSIQFSVAVTVLDKVAVDAMHSLFQMDVLQVNSFLELIRIAERNVIVIGIEQDCLCDRA